MLATDGTALVAIPRAWILLSGLRPIGVVLLSWLLATGRLAPDKIPATITNRQGPRHVEAFAANPNLTVTPMLGAL